MTILGLLLSIAVVDTLVRLITISAKLLLILACKAAAAARCGQAASGSTSFLPSWCEFATQAQGQGLSMQQQYRGVRRGGGGGAGRSGLSPRAQLKREAALLKVVDVASMCYRQLLPVPLWWRYLLWGATSNAVLASLLTGGYSTQKAADLWRAGKRLVAAVRSAVAAGQGYGRPATPEEEAATNGGQCPVCQVRPVEALLPDVALACLRMPIVVHVLASMELSLPANHRYTQLLIAHEAAF
jgi:hypothetical protein